MKQTPDKGEAFKPLVEHIHSGDSTYEHTQHPPMRTQAQIPKQVVTASAVSSQLGEVGAPI